MKKFRDFAKKLPDSPGVYKYLNSDKKIIYIGKAKSLKKRVLSYFQNKDLGEKANLLVSQIDDIQVLKVFTELEALLLEAKLIRAHQPFFNIEAKDDKSPLYIKITADSIPLISTSRKQDISNKDFIKGPFRTSTTAKDILRLVRRIFPYCHHKNPKKPCLYVHLGMCPYPWGTKKATRDYLKNIVRIKRFLNGQNKLVIDDLKKEMVKQSKSQNYELANELKIQINKLEELTTAYHTPREFLERPTLVDDLTAQKIKELQHILNLRSSPKRIECYDISNIQGKNATGSMIVFENGKKNTSEYRKFKIKFKKRPDDYEMLREVLSRRFKNTWPIADLMVIDGGKGQLSTATAIIQKYHKEIPVISLAKKREQIYTNDNDLPINLPKESAARQLLEELRNEAHRFAITYHRLLRSRNFIQKNNLAN